MTQFYDEVRSEDFDALIGCREQLRKCIQIMDSLRDFVAEGGSRSMIGAVAAIRESDEALKCAHAILVAADKVKT